jgi:hypothetical protein
VVLFGGYNSLRLWTVAQREMIRELEWALIGALVAVIGLVPYQQLASTTGARTPHHQASVTSDGTAHICVVNWHRISMELGSANIQRLPETGRRPTMLGGKSITGSTGPGVWLLLRYHLSCPRKRRS